jgi:hypothetical protein
MKNFTLLLLTTFSLSAASGQTTGKVDLKKGQKYNIETVINTTATQEFAGTPIDIVADVNTTNLIEVDNVDDKNFSLNSSITKLNVSLNAAGREMKYDSDKKEDRDGELGGELNSLLNKATKLSLAANGKFAEPEKADAPTSELVAFISGLVGDFTKPYEAAIIVVPAGSKAGASWVDSSSNAGLSKRVTTYSLSEIKNNEASIKITGTMNTDGHTELMGQQVKVTSTGKVSGDAIVDVTTGLVKSRDMVLDATGVSEIMGQQMPVTTKINAKTKVTPAK